MPTSTQAKSHWDHANLSIVGLGLLGASLAEAARRKWPLIKITGISSIATIEKALQAKIIDRGFNYTEIDLACADADLIILCTPIDSILKTLEKWTFNRLLCKPNCIITDVGSTKQEICLAGEKAFDGAPGIFIGSHPMAGSEKTGLDARDPLLFQNASWVICLPSDLGGVDSSGENSSGKNYPSEAASLLEIFAKGLGARTTIMSPSLHDQVTAHVSHLPQLLATALASFIGSQKNVVDNCLQIAGGGFRDMTQIDGFKIKKGIFFTEDAAFCDAQGQHCKKRELTAQDFVYSYKRIYDPKNKSPVFSDLEEMGILGMDKLRATAEKPGAAAYRGHGWCRPTSDKRLRAHRAPSAASPVPRPRPALLYPRLWRDCAGAMGATRGSQ